MKFLQWDRKVWQLMLNIEIIYIIFINLLFAVTTFKPNLFATIIIFAGLLVLNYYQDKNKYLPYFAIWLNLMLIPNNICIAWANTGNFLLDKLTIISPIIVIIMWAFWLVLLVPLAMTSASRVNNWFLRLLAVLFLNVQFGQDIFFKIKHLPFLASFNDQGVITALAFLILICFLSYSWGFRFNPNLKFEPSLNFKWSVFTSLIVLLVINVLWNDFGGNGETIFSMLFSFSADIQAKYFTLNSLTAALRPAILEEAERYIWMIIFLAGFNHYRKWRVPVAVYASTLLFSLSHFTNVGVDGQSFMATVSQVIAVSDAMIWAVVFLYIGKLWIPMISHFFMDYLINIQSGWSSVSSWNGSFPDWATTFIPVIFGLAVTIWMMFGERRKVMEENADRLLQIHNYNDFFVTNFI